MERLTPLTPSAVDLSKLRNENSIAGSSIDLSYVLSTLDEFQYEFIDLKFLGGGNFKRLEAHLLHKAAGLIKRVKGRHEHLPALVRTELLEALSDGTCEVCEGSGFNYDETKVYPCDNCRTTGKAKVSLKTKIRWYAQTRYELRKEQGKEADIGQYRKDYVKYIRDAYDINSIVTNSLNEANEKIKRRLR